MELTSIWYFSAHLLIARLNLGDIIEINTGVFSTQWAIYIGNEQAIHVYKNGYTGMKESPLRDIMRGHRARINNFWDDAIGCFPKEVIALRARAYLDEPHWRNGLGKLLDDDESLVAQLRYGVPLKRQVAPFNIFSYIDTGRIESNLKLEEKLKAHSIDKGLLARLKMEYSWKVWVSGFNLFMSYFNCGCPCSDTKQFFYFEDKDEL